MALTKLEENLNIIENLSDSPTLESDELKRKFDEGSLVIKNYLNEVLTKEIDDIVTQIKKDVNAKLLEDNKKKYYVGKLIFDTKNVNPATYLGFGTWQLWGAGRVPVGINTNDGNFNTVEKTGGNKAVDISHKHTIASHNHGGNTGSTTLTVDQIPSHSHIKYAFGSWGSSSYNRTRIGAGVYIGKDQGNPQYEDETNDTTGKTGGGKGHIHTIAGSGQQTTRSGGSTSVSLLQPYITCYIWKRIN